MDMLLQKTPHGLRGWTAEDQRAYEKFKRRLVAMAYGDCFRLDFRVPRNLAQHKKFWALVSLIAETSETFDNLDKAICAVKVAAGHCDFIANPETGELIAVPRSISFANMDQVEFETFYDNAVNGVLKFLLPLMNRVSLDDALDRVVQF